MHRSNTGERGFALITAGLCSVAILGMLGLAVDLGRLYIVRGEMQTYVDSLSLAAAAELDGTAAGIARALNAMGANGNRWNLGTSGFTGTQVDFATGASGPWVENPMPAAGYTHVRVQASGTAKLYFIPTVSSRDSARIAAVAVAGQVPKPAFPSGLMPFSPFAHDPAAPDFGFIPGERYTLRWPSNAKLNTNVCAGDNAQQWVDLAEWGGISERGYIEENSSSVIRQAIIDSYQTRPLSLGTPLVMTGGNKQTQRDSLIERIDQDTDPVSATYAEYEAAGAGNGRRLVGIAVNDGSASNLIAGFGMFFLLPPSEYDPGGNRPFCAEYVGPYVEGSRHKGAGPPGAYAVRLVE